MKCAVLSCVWLYGAISIIDASLTWSTTYHLKAVLTVPAANITEPYEVWYNGDTGYSRVDFYNGVDKIYRKVQSSYNVKYYKVHPETTEKFVNKQMCYEMDTGTMDTKMYAVNSYLPMKNFKFIKNEDVNGVKAEKWEAIVITDRSINLKHVFTVWIHKHSTSITEALPIKYTYQIKFGENILDSYHHDYKHYEIKKFEDGVYRIPDGIPCSSVSSNTSVHEPIDPLLEFVDPLIEHSRITQAFERFKLRYNKQYRHEAEHSQRMYTFKNNLRFINSINRQHRSFSLAVNHLVDRSDDELSVLLGTKHSVGDFDAGYKLGEDEDEDRIASDAHDEELNGNISKSFDWRDYGAVTSIKDQTLLCGSCYAFTTTAAVESAAYVSRGCQHLEEVSEQAIIDCTWSTGLSGNMGCNGGTFEHTLIWAKTNGLPLKKEYGPYLVMEGLCHNMNMTKLVTFNNVIVTKHKKHAIKKSLLKDGPLLAAIDGSPKTFSFYSKGIYDDSKCRSEPYFRSHGVTVIGYGRESDKEYWIIKNSYGTGWGEKGYMRLATKYNICGLKNFATAVSYTKTNVEKCFVK